MFRSTVQVQTGFGELDSRIRQFAERVTRAGAAAAAETAQANASIDLQLEQLPPHEDPDGVAAGIKSKKKGNRDTLIADFFDEGTLGNRRKKLKRPGRTSWTVKRGSGSYTAQRQDVDDKGIPAERFFPKAKAAGRRAMRAELEKGA